MSFLGTIEIHAGDFAKGKNSQFLVDHFLLKVDGKFLRQKIPIGEVEELEPATEENVKKLGGTVGWGIAGAALLGPVGLLAGLIAGGKKKMVTFVCRLKDGRRFLGSTDSKTWIAMMAARF